MSRLLFIGLFVACGGAPSPSETPTAPVETTTSEAQVSDGDQASKDWEYYGEAFTVTKSIPASEVIGNPAAHLDGPIRVTGTVSDVCQKKGCWLVLSEGENHMRVLMKDHSFAVNMKGTGFLCDIEGTVVAEKPNPDATAHYESEGQEGAPVPEKGDTEVTYRLIASSVRMRKGS